MRICVCEALFNLKLLIALYKMINPDKFYLLSTTLYYDLLAIVCITTIAIMSLTKYQFIKLAGHWQVPAKGYKDSVLESHHQCHKDMAQKTWGCIHRNTRIH